MISLSDACIDEMAMVIEGRNASVAKFAVMGSEGWGYLARGAYFSTGIVVYFRCGCRRRCRYTGAIGIGI